MYNGDSVCNGVSVCNRVSLCNGVSMLTGFGRYNDRSGQRQGGEQGHYT